MLLLSMILVPFAASFALRVQFEASTAMNVSEQLKVENAIDGQYEIMVARLRHDLTESEVDSLDDGWNAEDLLERKDDEVGVALTTHIWDEQGKLNLRLLAEGAPERRQLTKQRLQRLLVRFRRDTRGELSFSEAERWAEQIFEYVNGRGPRSMIPKPRMADDRPILLLDELDMLPKVRDRRFSWLLHDQRDKEDILPGLHRYVTIYGTGRLNLNTVSPVVLAILFPQDEELAERIIERRESPPEEGEEGDEDPFGDELDEDGQPAGNPYTDVNQVNEVEGVTQKALAENQVDLGADFDVRSNVFSFRIVAETDATRRDELFVVERVPGPTPEDPMEGFRLRLRQERIDPVERIEEDDGF